MKKTVRILITLAFIQTLPTQFVLSEKLENEQQLIKTIEKKIVDGKLDLTSFTVKKKIDVKVFESALKKVFTGKRSQEITNLNLSNNQLTSITSLSNLKRLQHLDLSHNQISFIQNLRTLSALINLDLSENNFEIKPNLPEHLEPQAELILKNTPYAKKLEHYTNKILSIINNKIELSKENISPKIDIESVLRQKLEK